MRYPRRRRGQRVAHAFLQKRIAAAGPLLAEGEIAVVKPEGDSKFRVVGRIRIEEWAFLE